MIWSCRATRPFRPLPSALTLLWLAGLPLMAAGRPTEGSVSEPLIWLDPAGSPLPFQTHEAVLDFLEEARVVSRKAVGSGMNSTQKLLLERGGVFAHAAFRQASREYSALKAVGGRFRPRFRDDFIFEAAAYRLSRWLGLDCIPPTLKRKIAGVQGTLQLWIEGAQTASQRPESEAPPGDALEWTRQIQVMRLFDRLVQNDDRNLGNQLIDGRGKLWLIDHTRAFGLSPEVKTPQGVYWCSLELWQRLRQMELGQMEELLKPYLRRPEIRGLLLRRDALVVYLEDLIRERGSERVLYTN